MEYTKKDKILDTAMDLFRKKGFSAASIQDIAEACGVAKASIYKFYPSKEELFTAAFTACHQTLLEQASELNRSGMSLGLSLKKKLSRKIEFYLYYILENHALMTAFHEPPLMQNMPFLEAQRKMTGALLIWQKEMLIETFGEGLEPYVWDAVLIFQGILHEYMNGILRKVISQPIAEIADFIADRMEAVAQDLIRTAPRSIGGERIVRSHPVERSDEAARKGTVRDFLAAMEERIQALPLPEPSRMELCEVVALLQQEVLAEKPNLTLLRVLKSHLEAVPELRSYLRQLKLLLT